MTADPPWTLSEPVLRITLRPSPVVEAALPPSPVIAVPWPRVRVTRPLWMPDRPSMIVLRRRRDQATRSPMPGGLAAMLGRPIRA